MKRCTPLNRNIGAKIKYYRKQQGLTQKQLAARLQTSGCDVTETMLGHMETGYRSTSVYEIDKLAEVLHLPRTDRRGPPGDGLHAPLDFPRGIWYNPDRIHPAAGGE